MSESNRDKFSQATGSLGSYVDREGDHSTIVASRRFGSRLMPETIDGRE
jgi:hypothetical protein